MILGKQRKAPSQGHVLLVARGQGTKEEEKTWHWNFVDGGREE
jgi:hypothetical protein